MQLTLVGDGDGAEACAALRAGRYDLVLMDVPMPVMDGLTATRAIRAWEVSTAAPSIPIVGLTADTMPEQLAACRAAGMDDVVAKPVEASVLFETMERVLANGQAAMAA